MIKGISTELNQEKQINQLYGYVENSEENAFYVANTLRKALLSDSPIACTIMGRILARHVSEGSTYDQDDNIIFHALENATDQDIKQFVNVMKYSKTDRGTFRIPCDDMNPEFKSFLEWCVYNRIFVSRMAEWEEIDDGVLDINTYYYEANPASVLLRYIDGANQTWNYS